MAIIGTGNIGSRLAAAFAAGGQDFLLAGRDQEAARKVAADLDGHADVVSVDEAVERADVLVLAVWFDAFKQLIAQYGDRLAGKVIIDPTNPVGPDGKGGFQKLIGEQESSGAADDDAAGEEVADLIRIAGYEPVLVGGLDQSIRLEVFGNLHELGALGRVVTKSEALEAI